ncbi:MAG: hypothetical protein Q7S28_00035 [bacterium]|nr:hypothetical protein [bacterium]
MSFGENGKIDFNGIIEKDAERKRQRHGDYREITFGEYLKLVEADPLLAQNSPSRLLEVILGGGTEEISLREQGFVGSKDAPTRYKLFSNRLFGVDRSVYQVVKYFEAGANQLSTGKQLLLLVGPTASGKSTFANILKHALENYSQRPVYKIKGCPMFEEPLHLLPRYLRGELEKALNVRIKGDLCPPCRALLHDNYTDPKTGVVNWKDVPVETFTFSIQGTRGIGSFEPSDEKSQDVTELVGRENISITSTKGYEHPLAYSLSGELEKANRGICEGRELIKADEKFLWVFISVAEEQEIKIQGSSFPHLSVDTVVVGHTNLNEFKKFSSNQANEALHDRIYVVLMPYPLRIQDEVKVYDKLIKEESNFAHLANCHIAPGSLELAALFAILTRLTESKMGVDLLTKAKYYNGERALTEIDDSAKNPVDLRVLIEEGQSNHDISRREGMFGVSSRDVLAAINTELVKRADGCLTPLAVVKALREVFEHRMGYAPEEIERFKGILNETVMAEYKDFVVRKVSQAFLRTYSDLAKELFEKYVREAKFHRSQKRKFVRGADDIARDTMTGKVKEPDEKFLRSIEEQVPVNSSEAEIFRAEILEYMATNPNFSFETYPPLARAVEKKLLSDSRAILSLVLNPDKPKGEEEKKRTKDLFDGLENEGCCLTCAREMVEKASEFLRD